MKQWLLWLGFVVVCLPMAFVMWLLTAVESPKMDAVTQHMPEGMKSLVVRGILGRSSGEPAMGRALKLDAAAVQSWKIDTRRAEQARVTLPRSTRDQQDLYRHQASDKKLAKGLAAQAKALEQKGKACDAVGLYAKAEELDHHADVFAYEEGMGRAELVCGDLQKARSSLETAVGKEERFLDGTQEDQLMDVRQSLKTDHELLVVVYDRQHESTLAAAACTEAHRGWKGCGCGVGANGEVKCEEKR